MAEYDKAVIKQILIDRDDDTAEDAQCRIDACQEDIDAGLDQDADILSLQNCIESHFGLEPDYLFCFLEPDDEASETTQTTE